MNWVTILWAMIASACLTLALMHLLVWLHKRTAWANLLFSLSAAATSAMTGCELWMMRTQTPAQFATAVRWIHVPIWVIILTLTGYVLVQMRAGRRWLAWTVCALRTFLLPINFLVGQNLNFLEITRLRSIPFLGETVSTPEGVVNPWMFAGQLSILLFLIFLGDATLTVWRRGDRRQALVIGGSIIFSILAATFYSALVILQVFRLPVMMSFFYMGIIAAMAGEMARQTLQSSQLLEDLCQKEEWLDLAADSAGVGRWLWDFKTNLIWATKKARQLYGFSLDEEIPFDKFLSRLHPDDLDWITNAARKSRMEGTDFRYDYRIVLPDGRLRWIKVLAKAFLTPLGVPERMTGVSIDITNRKKIELELQQKRNELNHINRVSTMGQLASTLAHELNQPLGAILRNAEAGELFLQGPSPDLDELRAILVDIRKDDLRAGEVIDRMRAMMKQRKAERRPLDLKLLTEEVVTLVQSDADKRHVRLSLDTDPILPLISGDRVQLQQVLVNLLLNAMDALDNNPPEKRLVMVSARAAGARVEVAVTDNGPGIAADQLTHVFDPFFSSKPDGLGMGLAISRGIIEAHGGRLWANNNKTGGATFTFTLPATTEKQTT